MVTTFESVLNYIIPTLLILVVVAFIWVKTPLGAWLGPHLHNLWLWIKGEQQESSHYTERSKTIVYE